MTLVQWEAVKRKGCPEVRGNAQPGGVLKLNYVKMKKDNPAVQRREVKRDSE